MLSKTKSKEKLLKQLQKKKAKILKKQDEINNLKEEMEKMAGKYKIEDGKVKKTDDAPAANQTSEPVAQQQQQQQQQPTLTQEEINQRIAQQQAMQEAMLRQQQAQMQQQGFPPGIGSVPPQEMQQTPSIPQGGETVGVVITMEDTKQYNVNIPTNAADQFFKELNEAMETGILFQLQRTFINARKIMDVSLQ
jgi:DNA primase